MTQLTTVVSTVEDDARRLAAYHAEAEPNVERAWLFPDESEIRLIETDGTAVPGDPGSEIPAFHFPEEPAADVHYKFAIAIIRPGEEQTLRPPAGWGGWEDAAIIWQRTLAYGG